MVLDDASKVNIVKGWERNGHELAAHHHGVRHPGGWDGYSNLPMDDIIELRTQSYHPNWPDKYLGNMNDYMAVLNQLMSPKVMCMGPDVDYDWPSQIPYSVEGVHESSSGYLTEKTYNHNKVYELPFRYIKQQADIEIAETEYLESQVDESVGVVLHPKQYLENVEGVEGWFQFLRENDPEVKYTKTASWIIENYLSKGITIEKAIGSSTIAGSSTWGIILLVGAGIFMFFGKKK